MTVFLLFCVFVGSVALALIYGDVTMLVIMACALCLGALDTMTRKREP